MILQDMSDLWGFLYNGFISRIIIVLRTPFDEWLIDVLDLPTDIVSPILSALGNVTVFSAFFIAGITVFLALKLFALIMNALPFV